MQNRRNLNCQNYFLVIILVEYWILPPGKKSTDAHSKYIVLLFTVRKLTEIFIFLNFFNVLITLIEINYDPGNKI